MTTKYGGPRSLTILASHGPPALSCQGCIVNAPRRLGGVSTSQRGTISFYPQDSKSATACSMAEGTEHSWKDLPRATQLESGGLTVQSKVYAFAICPLHLLVPVSK